MKKIMFNTKYGLEQAVLEGHKTITRRIIPQQILKKVEEYQDEYYNGALETISEKDAILAIGTYEYRCRFPQVGEVVAIAQSYRSVLEELYQTENTLYDKVRRQAVSAGYYNKMFVKAELMPHHIKITNIRVERLQDISDEDCLREGIMQYKDTCEYYYTSCNAKKDIDYRNIFPKGAFASLIDKVSGKGTWDRNPYVFVYEFELTN